MSPEKCRGQITISSFKKEIGLQEMWSACTRFEPFDPRKKLSGEETVSWYRDPVSSCVKRVTVGHEDKHMQTAREKEEQS